MGSPGNLFYLPHILPEEAFFLCASDVDQKMELIFLTFCGGLFKEELIMFFMANAAKPDTKGPFSAGTVWLCGTQQGPYWKEG